MISQLFKIILASFELELWNLETGLEIVKTWVGHFQTLSLSESSPKSNFYFSSCQVFGLNQKVYLFKKAYKKLNNVVQWKKFIADFQMTQFRQFLKLFGHGHYWPFGQFIANLGYNLTDNLTVNATLIYVILNTVWFDTRYSISWSKSTQKGDIDVADGQV